jgi:hypothetical protein
MLSESALENQFSQKKDALFLETYKFCQDFLQKQQSGDLLDQCSEGRIGAVNQFNLSLNLENKFQKQSEAQNSSGTLPLPSGPDKAYNIFTSAMLSIVLSHHFQKEEI